MELIKPKLEKEVKQMDLRSSFNSNVTNEEVLKYMVV